MYDIVTVDYDGGYDIETVDIDGRVAWLSVVPSVAQRVQQALKLMQGTWFLDLRDGMPWQTLTLESNKARIDAAIRKRILSVAGVVSVLAYRSVQLQTALVVDVDIETDLGPERISFELEV